MKKVEKSEIINRYLELRAKKAEIDEELKFLKSLLMANFKDGEIIGNKVVRFKTITQERLDTKKVKKFLMDTFGSEVYDRGFIKEVSYEVVKVKEVEE